MNPTLSFAEANVLEAPVVPAFWLRRSFEASAYHQLSLRDANGHLAHWVIPLPLKQLAKRPVLLWLLPESPALDSLGCIESGAMQLAPARPGADTNLQAELAQGVLRLNFSGELLRGYYRLQCLPAGNGQLWQLTPIGHV
ncbi:MAG: hypothetical protein ACRYFV_06000 [Janthinobacterium lividum]|jgi:hypothetical protein